MKIFTTSQIRKADQYTIENEPIESINLMERAAKSFVDSIKPILRKQDSIRFFCGMGNNGGDGWAAARMLLLSGFRVEVIKIVHSDKPSPDCVTNEKRFTKLKKAVFTVLQDGDNLPEIKKTDFIIDAIMGSGLTRPLEGFAARVLKHLNQSNARIIALDMPSGLFGENNTDNNPENIIRAWRSVTFQFPKLSFLFPENDVFTGIWKLADIGLHKDFIEKEDTSWHYLTASDLSSGIRRRNKFDHKGHFGHALLIAGCYGKSGAAVLASRAALQCGVGLLSVQVPTNNYSVQQSSVPEAMVLPNDDPDYFSGIKDTTPYSAVGAGPGLGKETITQNALKFLIQNTLKPLVFDADAINILAENLTWMSFLPPGSIITPHVGEFERLAGKCKSGWERVEKAREMAFRFRIYIVLKGAHTAIVCPDKQVIFNSTGNPGMATGGSGDVLTGMILSFMAQNYSSLYSCMAGVYLHGLAGDMAARRKGEISMTASDIIFFIPKAIQTISSTT